MALNISIDVDGTLLDENENVTPQAREKITHLKSKGHHLQLWSTGGAAYAQKVSIKHKLTDLFDSYGTKPDLALDDVPESTRPVAILKADQTFPLPDAIELLQSKVEHCVESVLHPGSDLVAFVERIQNSFTTIPPQTRESLGINPLPIPFFGNLDHARFVTVGLNPSSTEFAPWREWGSVSGPAELTFRLVNYFRLANITLPPPHPWFGEILEACHNLRCPHGLAAAHTDYCPWATLSPTWLGNRDRQGPLQGGLRRLEVFWRFIDEQMATWLGETFARCHNSVKLVVMIETDQPTVLQQDRQARAKAIIRNALGPECEIVSHSRAKLVGWTWQHRERVRNLIDFPNVVA